MIQSYQPKHSEAPKAQPKVVKSEVNSNIKKLPLKTYDASPESVSSEFNEFESQLKSEMKTNLVNVNGEMSQGEISSANSNELINPLLQNPSSEGLAAPKIDSVLSNNSQNIVSLENLDSVNSGSQLSEAQILELANSQNADDGQLEIKSQFEQLLGKSVNKNNTSNSLVSQTNELDASLISNEEFLAQKNLYAKKQVSNPYGLKGAQGHQQKMAIESGLSDTQVVKELSKSEGSSVNSQQFILGLQQKESQSFQLSETQSNVKVFDISHIKSTNTNEIMNQITDYVIQAKAAKEPTVNMRVKHEDLGLIDITVSKSGLGQESIAVNIGTHSLDAKNFFQINTKELFSHLSTAGLNVTDLKVESSNQTAKNDADFGSQSGKNQQGSDKQFGSEQNQRRHESERRQDMWKLFNKEAA